MDAPSLLTLKKDVSLAGKKHANSRIFSVPHLLCSPDNHWKMLLHGLDHISLTLYSHLFLWFVNLIIRKPIIQLHCFEFENRFVLSQCQRPVSPVFVLILRLSCRCSSSYRWRCRKHWAPACYINSRSVCQYRKLAAGFFSYWGGLIYPVPFHHFRWRYQLVQAKLPCLVRAWYLVGTLHKCHGGAIT